MVRCVQTLTLSWSPAYSSVCIVQAYLRMVLFLWRFKWVWGLVGHESTRSNCENNEIPCHSDATLYLSSCLSPFPAGSFSAAFQPAWVSPRLEESRTKLPCLAYSTLCLAYNWICGKSCTYSPAPFSHFPPAPQLLSLAFAPSVFRRAQQPPSAH